MLNSSFQRLLPSLATQNSSSVPIADSRAASVTGTCLVPARLPPRRTVCKRRQRRQLLRRRREARRRACRRRAPSRCTAGRRPAGPAPVRVPACRARSPAPPRGAAARRTGRCARRSSGAAEGDVVRARDAAADAFAAGVPQPGEVGRPQGDGEVERRVRQHERLPGRVVPAAHDVEEPVAQAGGLEDAAVEEDRRGTSLAAGLAARNAARWRVTAGSLT